MAERKRPQIIGLTGSIGMGKTETARMFQQLGVPVHDADAAVHRLYEPGGAAVEPIAKVFPGCVREGRVDRERLSECVHSNRTQFDRLEAIVHPLVAADQQAFIEQAAALGADVVVLDIPLLFETGGETRVDAVVVVTASAETQRERVLARPGMSDEILERILTRQTPDVEKRARAHFVVETGKGLGHAFEQVKSVLAALRTQESHA
ncbi:MAG TPA: dephospho-CoA kinase [Rhizomicrobium sp.]